ncbi:hypothetical protein RB653_003527 [Dictyostelium firmibasis]|uniref:Uncharacterized protein n=1 Tax=Dictyostelium firmibasis TaxID=79012 RepID=A0AAN7YX29_9MYCE
MTERIVDFRYVNRVHNPHPREFLGGYHTGAVCRHDSKGRLLPMKHERYLMTYTGNSDPRRYKNSLYGNPLLHKNGYHERHFLLKGREYFVPMYFDRPYYIEQCTLNDTITRSDLARRNPNNSYVLANRLDDYGKYHYQQEKLYQDKQVREDFKLAKAEKKNEYIANKAVLEKEGLFRAVERNDMISKKPISIERPIFKNDTGMATNTIVYETVPITSSSSQILIPEKTIITETTSVIDQQPVLLEKQTTTTTTTTSSDVGNVAPPQETIVPQLQMDQTPIFKEEVVLVPHIEEDTSTDNQQLSYSEITQVPIQMTSSEFGGGNNNNSGSSGRRGKKGKKQQYRKEIITKQSTDGGKSWTNDSKLAGDNVEYIEEQTTIRNQ